MLKIFKKGADGNPILVLTDPSVIGSYKTSVDEEDSRNLVTDLTELQDLADAIKLVLEGMYTKEQIDSMVSNVNLAKIKGQVESVDLLPTEGNKNGDIYFVGTVDATDMVEYIYLEELERFEFLGSMSSVSVDLSEYYKKTEADAATEAAIAPVVERVEALEAAAPKPSPNFTLYDPNIETETPLNLTYSSPTRVVTIPPFLGVTNTGRIVEGVGTTIDAPNVEGVYPLYFDAADNTVKLCDNYDTNNPYNGGLYQLYLTTSQSGTTVSSNTADIGEMYRIEFGSSAAQWVASGGNGVGQWAQFTIPTEAKAVNVDVYNMSFKVQDGEYELTEGQSLTLTVEFLNGSTVISTEDVITTETRVNVSTNAENIRSATHVKLTCKANDAAVFAIESAPSFNGSKGSVLSVVKEGTKVTVLRDSREEPKVSVDGVLLGLINVTNTGTTFLTKETVYPEGAGSEIDLSEYSKKVEVEALVMEKPSYDFVVNQVKGSSNANFNFGSSVLSVEGSSLTLAQVKQLFDPSNTESLELVPANGSVTITVLNSSQHALDYVGFANEEGSPIPGTYSLSSALSSKDVADGIWEKGPSTPTFVDPKTLTARQSASWDEGHGLYECAPHFKLVVSSTGTAITLTNINLMVVPNVRAIVDTALKSGSASNIKGVLETVDLLPTEGNVNGDIWFVGAEGAEDLEEYIFLESLGRFELLGTRSSGSVDLSEYYKKTEADAAMAEIVSPVADRVTALENAAPGTSKLGAMTVTTVPTEWPTELVDNGLLFVIE